MAADLREIKCCCKEENCRQSGISFTTDSENKPMLNFHFLETETINKRTFTDYKTRAMYLNKKNINQLIKTLNKLL